MYGVEREDYSPRIFLLMAESPEEAIKKFYENHTSFDSNPRGKESYNIFYIERETSELNSYGNPKFEFVARKTKKG